MPEEFRHTEPPARGRPSRLVVFDRLDRAVDELVNVGGLPTPTEAEAIWEGLWYEETHNSTAIEGNTLVLREVRTLLDEGRAVGDKELREYLEVQGYGEAAQWVYKQAHGAGLWTETELITLAELREMHVQAVGPVWLHFPPSDHDTSEGPGAFRRHNIEPFVGGMRPPPWTDVPPRITDWISQAQKLKAYSEEWFAGGMSLSNASDHPVFHIAALHAGIERIHPFRDGNGRAGRLALNLMLVRLGYPPAVIYKKDRAKYLRSLDRADKGDAGPLAELIARAVMNGINRFLLPALAGPKRLIPLTALADADLSLIALRRAADRGRLRALRKSDQWYSTREWVNEYKASRKRGRARTIKDRPVTATTTPPPEQLTF
ncbi:MAG: Fic family protein [Gaiellaceae bacterium]